MANLKNFDDDDQNGNATATGGVITGGANKAGGAAQQGTGWVNLQSYLTNNQGAGAGMANDITKDTTAKIGENNNAVNAWETSAKAGVDKGTKQNVYGQTFQNGSAKDVAGVDQNAFNAWKGAANYSGAKNAQTTEGYDNVYTNVNNTKVKINNLGTYEGQKAALGDTYGQNGNYGNGFKALDAFLMRGDQSGKDTIENFQTANARYGQGFQTATDNVNQYIGGAEGRGAQNQADTTNALNSRYGAIQNKGTAARDADSQSIYQQDLMTANQIAPKDNNSFTGLGGAQYVTQNAGDAQAYLDPDEPAALNNLAGIDDSADTNALGAGSRPKSGLDMQALQKFLIPNVGTLAPGQSIPLAPDQFQIGAGGAKQSLKKEQDEQLKMFGGF